MSNTKNTGGAAFPTPEHVEFHEDLGQGKSGYREYMASSGMTLRDYFAAKIMQGWMSDPQVQPLSTTSWDKWAFNTSVNAYKVADAMLKAREQ